MKFLFHHPIVMTLLLVTPLLLVNSEGLGRFMERWWSVHPLLFSSVFFAPGIFLLVRSLWRNRLGPWMKSNER